MSNLEQQLSKYAAYHLNHKNILTHFIGIPLIVFSILCLTAKAGVDIGSFKLTLAIVLKLLHMMTSYNTTVKTALKKLENGV